MIRASLLLIAVGACGTNPPQWTIDAGSCAMYVVPPTTDLTMPVVSFKTDVVPIFNDHCATKACHGTTSDPAGSLFLGPVAAVGPDGSAVYAGLVSQPSGEFTGMKFVQPGDPVRSYLMHKLDGDQCLYDSMCNSSSCQHSMPSNLGVLTVEARDTVRRWIAQGAADN